MPALVTCQDRSQSASASRLLRVVPNSRVSCCRRLRPRPPCHPGGSGPSPPRRPAPRAIFTPHGVPWPPMTVVISGDQPPAVPLLEDPGRVHLTGVRNLGLAGEQDA